MSYCRFSWDNSDVYVYEGSEGIVCCGCQLQDHFVAGKDSDDDHPEAAMGMVMHLREHSKAGHVVPLHAIAELSEEAGQWTKERIRYWINVRYWRALKKLVCSRRGHVPIHAMYNRDGEGVLEHRKCARCHRGWGLEIEGQVEWLGED